MKMITKEIERRLPALYSQEKNPNPTVVCKFFTPWSNWTWYVTEGQKQPDGDYLFFGFVVGHDAELGYFSLNELMSVRGPAGLKVERDMWFTPTPLDKIRSQHER